MSTKKVVYFSGSRADYALMVPILKALKKEAKVDLSIIAAHMHLDRRFGLTVKEIEKDGFKIIGKVRTKIEESRWGMLSEFQTVIKKLPQILQREKPDCLLIQGDRVESLAATNVAFLQKIPVIHVSGGCVTGSMDNGFRWSMTQLAEWHFPATKKDAERIINSGKPANRVFTIGEPGLDVALKKPLGGNNKLWKKLNLNLNRKLWLVIFHPDTAETRYSPTKQIKPLLDVVKQTQEQIIQIYPNADTGGLAMRQLIDKYAQQRKDWQVLENLAHKDLLGLFKSAEMVIGNSSGAIVETPSFKVPVIDIGNRQEGREKASNIISSGYKQNEIRAAIRLALSSKFKNKAKQAVNPYGDGTAAKKFIKVFKEKIL